MTIDRTTPLCLIWAVGGVISLFMSFGQSGLRAKLLHTHSAVSLAIAVFYCLGYEEKLQPVGKVAEVIAPTATPPSQNLPVQAGLKIFDWDDLRNIDLFPSLAIMGKPGTGKTVLGEWLLYQLQGESRVITTKRKSSQWRGLPVFGVPRNFEAIASALSNLVTELGDRIANLDAEHVALNVAIDELPAIALNIPNLKDYLQPLILEARETKIRPIFLMHGDEVELLGIQGKGSLRKSITYIRLGNFALEYAQELINKKRADVSLISWLEQQSRPCLVDSYPAIVPNLANWKPTISISTGTETTGNNFPQLETGKSLGNNDFPVSGDTEIISNDADFQLKMSVKALLEIGKTETWIIQNILGFKGRRYQEGKQRLDKLLSL